MKKLFVLFILTVIITLPLYSAYANGNTVNIYQGSSLIGTMTVDDFKLMVKDYNLFKDIMKAQADNNLRVDLIDNVYVPSVEQAGSYKAKMKISWMSESNKVINYIIVESQVEILKDGQLYPKWRIAYRDFSEIGFPASVVLNIVLILAIAL
jgi:hypothetical protein